MAIWTPTQKVSAKKLKTEGLKHIYEIEVPAAKIQEEMQNVYVQLQLQARVQGYRQGKAPLDVIKRQYGDSARSEAAERAIKASIPEVLKDLKMRPVAMPNVTKVQMPADGPMTFELHIETAPEIKVTGYKGIAVEKKEYEVKDADVDARVKQLQDGNARLEKASDAAAGKTHYVVLDYELSRDGKALEGGKGKQELVDMSSEQTVDGLIAGLMGMKVDEEKEFDVKLNDKPAKCKAKVIEIKTKILPKLDDEFAKDMGVDSLAKLKEELSNIIKKENDEKGDRELSQQIEKGLLEANKFDVPPSLVEHQTKHMFDRLIGGMGGQAGQISDKQKADLLEKLKPQAAETVRLQFILSEVANVEKVEANDDDFKAEKERALAGAKDDKEKAEMDKFYEERKDDVLATLRERKVISLIREAAKVKTVKA
jgi:trigger factor